jgi:hypothetical protein
MKIVLYLILLVVLLGSVYADSNGVWHYAKDVRPGIFGSDENLEDFSFMSNVGIGTTNPTARLEIEDSSTVNSWGEKVAILKIRNPRPDSLSVLQLLGDGSSEPSWDLRKDEDGNFIIRELNAEVSGKHFMIKPGGNIGVGTTNPQAKLDVEGKIKMRSKTLASDSDDTVATKNYVDAKELVRNLRYEQKNTGYGTTIIRSPSCKADEILISCGVSADAIEDDIRWGSIMYQIPGDLEVVASEEIGENSCRCEFYDAGGIKNLNWARCYSMCLKIS